MFILVNCTPYWGNNPILGLIVSHHRTLAEAEKEQNSWQREAKKQSELSYYNMKILGMRDDEMDETFQVGNYLDKSDIEDYDCAVFPPEEVH